MAANANQLASVRVNFEGMMVFHKDKGDGHFEVGILEKVEHHSLKITVTPNPATGSGKLELTPEDIERLRRLGRWFLEVRNLGTGEPRKELLASPAKPVNRHDPNGDLKDFGWIIDMESDEFHGEQAPLTLAKGLLNPIMHLSNGRLYTFCKTNGLDTIHQSKGTRHLGFIAETIALGINIRPDEHLTLRAVGAQQEEVIFTIPHSPNTPYLISIMNTPDMVHDEAAPPTDHFQFYYKLLFPDVAVDDRFALKLTDPAEISPNLCASVKQHKDGDEPLGHVDEPHNHGDELHAHGSVALNMMTVDPYLCGGILLGERQDSLE